MAYAVRQEGSGALPGRAGGCAQNAGAHACMAGAAVLHVQYRWGNRHIGTCTQCRWGAHRAQSDARRETQTDKTGGVDEGRGEGGRGGGERHRGREGRGLEAAAGPNAFTTSGGQGILVGTAVSLEVKLSE